MNTKGGIFNVFSPLVFLNRWMTSTMSSDLLSAVPMCTAVIDDELDSFSLTENDSDFEDPQMADIWYHRAHAADTVAGAVRMQWVRDGNWKTWQMPFSGREGLEEMRSKLESSLEETIPGLQKLQKPKKVKRKNEISEKEEIQQALKTIPKCETIAENYFQLIDRKYTIANPEPPYCSCLLSSLYVKSCGDDITHRIRCRSIKVRLLETGDFGLTFQGLLLTATVNEDALLFVGFRLHSLNHTPLYSWQQLQSILRLHKENQIKAILLTFHPKYMITNEVQTVGSQVPLYRHSVYDSTWKYLAPLSVFGPGLMLENITSTDSASLFQCVLLQTNKKRVKRTRYAASFKRSHLRYIYPTVFSDFINEDAGRHNPSAHLFSVHSAVRELIDVHKKDDLFTLFNRPVHPGFDGIPTYLGVTKRPMDLGTISILLDNGLYDNEEQVLDDISLVWFNCREFNPEGNSVHEYATKLHKSFTSIFTKYHNLLEFSSQDSESEEASLLRNTPAATELIDLVYDTPQYSPLFIEIIRILASFKNAGRWAVQKPRRTPVEDDDDDDDVDVVFKINIQNITKEMINSVKDVLQSDDRYSADI